MKIGWIATACLALAACASSPSNSDLTQSEAGSAAPASEADLTNVREVSLDSFADLAMCRRYVATGTRIAVERCEPNRQSAADRVEYEQTRQDVESMRRQQMYQEQARQQAIAEAARRRMGGP
jgi:hypothetical protein